MTKTILAMVISLAVVMSVSLSCRKPSAAGAEQRPQGGEDVECLKWKDVVAGLSQEEKERLLREGALRKEEVGLILSDSLVGDCRLRNEMSTYMLRVVNGRSENNQEDRQFAAQHSPQIVAVLRRIWPSLGDSKALVGDGNFNSEKYNLLADPALKESDLAPLVNDILRAETIDNNLAKILFSRPMPGTMQTLVKLQTDAEAAHDVSWQITNLALLQRMGDSSALHKLKNLLRNERLTTNQRKTLTTLVTKAERGEELRFSDVENLEYDDY